MSDKGNIETSPAVRNPELALPFIQEESMKPQVNRSDIYRQGDVLLQRINRLPENALPVEWQDRVVLAYGEVTGHAHAISTKHATMYMSKGERLLEIKPGAALVHEEHATINLPEGFYKVVQQREYVPEAPPRDVAD
jgi:hypothetical protein